MRIKEILSEYGNDFYAIYECEHCGHATKKSYGYHDNYFHTQVIPGRWCPEWQEPLREIDAPKWYELVLRARELSR